MTHLPHQLFTREPDHPRGVEAGANLQDEDALPHLPRPLHHLLDLDQIPLPLPLLRGVQEPVPTPNVQKHFSAALVALGDEVRPIRREAHGLRKDERPGLFDPGEGGEEGVGSAGSEALEVGIRALGRVYMRGGEVGLAEEVVGVGSEDGVG